MNNIVTILLNILTALAPSLSTASTSVIKTVLDSLIVLVPLVVAEYKAVAPFVKNIIQLLKDHNAVTPEQLQTLDILETQIDASFELAAAAALEEDAAAQPKS